MESDGLKGRTTKNPEKTGTMSWQSALAGTIVRALFSIGVIALGFGAGESVNAESAHPAADANEAYVETVGKLAVAQKKLQDLRRRFADKYLENRRLQQRLAVLEWTVADWLQSKKQGVGLPEKAQLLERNEELRQQCRAIHREMLELRRLARQNGGARIADDAEETAFEAQLRRVLQTSRQAASLPPEVAGRGGADGSQPMHVLTVDDELQAVIVNSGRNDGVVAGSRWQAEQGDGEPLILEVAETGQWFSVAIPLEGQLSTVGPGSPLVPASGQ